jgi:hypothetical protein
VGLENAERVKFSLNKELFFGPCQGNVSVPVASWLFAETKSGAKTVKNPTIAAFSYVILSACLSVPNEPGPVF